MSVEALASSWARQEQAPDGAVVVIDNEISGRLRGGEPWTLRGADAVMLAMVARPKMDPLHEALLWLPASLAAADALSATTDGDYAVLWPDRVVDPASTVRRCAVNVLVQLGPGRVEHSIFAVRIDAQSWPEDQRASAQADEIIPPFVASARRYLEMLVNDPTALLAAYSDRCGQMDQRVRVEMLPRGEARGRVAAVDRDGFLVLESPTGMIERIAPASLRSIETVS